LTTLVSLNSPKVLPYDDLQFVLVVLSTISSVVISFVTFLNPHTKWLQFRGGALALETEIWKFRTRTGAYTSALNLSATVDREPENLLKDNVQLITTQVIKSASVSNTGFLAKFNTLFKKPQDDRVCCFCFRRRDMFRHGQRRSSRHDGTYSVANRGLSAQSTHLHDDHHSPITPNVYLELRVMPMLSFYQKRLPTYDMLRLLWEGLLILSSLMGTILAFIQMHKWASVATTLASLVTAYNGFHCTERKVMRYSEVVTKVDSIIAWWRSLTDVEQARVDYVSDLILGCEAAFQKEQQSWMSSGIAASKERQKK